MKKWIRRDFSAVCKEAQEAMEKYDSFQEFWDECDRGDWMLFYVVEFYEKKRLSVEDLNSFEDYLFLIEQEGEYLSVARLDFFPFFDLANDVNFQAACAFYNTIELCVPEEAFGELAKAADLIRERYPEV